ncbi:MAG: hypothetical protein K6G72_02155 [Lachnospiraceae bacterium]|nr:hypothetical protein [Lachnospiraceae bacterium]
MEERIKKLIKNELYFVNPKYVIILVVGLFLCVTDVVMMSYSFDFRTMFIDKKFHFLMLSIFALMYVVTLAKVLKTDKKSDFDYAVKEKESSVDKELFDIQNDDVDRRTGEKEAGAGIGYNFIIILVSVMSLLAFFAALLGDWGESVRPENFEDLIDWYPALIANLILLGLINYATLFKVVVKGDRIIYRNGFGRVRVYRLSDVKYIKEDVLVTKSTTSKYYRIIGQNGRTLFKIHRGMLGWRSLIEFLKGNKVKEKHFREDYEKDVDEIRSLSERKLFDYISKVRKARYVQLVLLISIGAVFCFLFYEFLTFRIDYYDMVIIADLYYSCVLSFFVLKNREVIRYDSINLDSAKYACLDEEDKEEYKMYSLSFSSFLFAAVLIKAIELMHWEEITVLSGKGTLFGITVGLIVLMSLLTIISSTDKRVRAKRIAKFYVPGIAIGLVLLPFAVSVKCATATDKFPLTYSRMEEMASGESSTVTVRLKNNGEKKVTVSAADAQLIEQGQPYYVEISESFLGIKYIRIE